MSSSSIIVDSSAAVSLLTAADVWQRQWPDLFVAFRQSAARRAAALRRCFPTAADSSHTATVTATLAGMAPTVLDAAVAALRSGVSGSTTAVDDYHAFLVHLQLLEFVQEHARYLCGCTDSDSSSSSSSSSVPYDAAALAKLWAPLADALLAVGDACANRWQFKSQVAVTLTTLVVELDVLHHDPPRVLALVHWLMALAFGSAALRSADESLPASLSRSPSRLLREMSCRCLAMLERTSGGLLAGSLAVLTDQLRSEPTHATQAFAELLTDVVYGAIVVAAHESAAALDRKHAPFDGNPIGHFLHAPTQFQLTTLALPTALDVLRAVDAAAPADAPTSIQCAGGGASFAVARVALSPAGVRALTQCVSPLIEAVPMLERYGVVHVLTHLMAIARLVGDTTVLGADLFRRQFARFLLTDTPYVTHAALLLRKWFPAALSDVAERTLVHRVLETTQLPLLASEQRYAALQWVAGLSCLQSPRPQTSGDARALEPFSELLYAHACDDAREIEERVLLLAWCAPLASAADAAAVVQRLQSIGDFRSAPANSRRVKVWFDAVRCLLQRAADAPPAFEVVLTTILGVVREDDAHRFSARLIKLLSDTDGSVADRLALAFAELLESLPAAALRGFVGLAERVVARPCVDAGRVLKALRRMLLARDATTLHNDWALGMSVLAVVRRTMLKRAPSDAVGEPRVIEHADLLSDVLERLARENGDVDVRDRALLYHSLLAHLGATRIRALLEPPTASARGGQSAQAESEAGLSALFHPLEADEHVRVPTFLRCERAPQAAAQVVDGGALRLRLRVSFDGAVKPPARAIVLAGELMMRAEPCFCDAIAPLDLPPLLHDSASNSSAEVALVVVPLVPLPCTLTGDCVFNDADGAVCTTVVQSHVQLAFRDLVWPAFDERSAFDAAWQRIDESLAATAGTACGERSARMLQRVDGARWRALCATTALAPFVVDGGACDLVALRLLPSWHVLMRVVAVGDETRLDVRTDFWRCLQHLDQWLDDVIGSS